MIIPLSYPLSGKTPLYPSTEPPVVHPLRRMDQGATANTSAITFSTHSGTHIDAPWHFCRDGKTIADCLATGISFFPAYVIDIPKMTPVAIEVPDLERHLPQVRDAESLVIRTGWHKVRSDDPERYRTDHPWISPAIPRFIRAQCPKLRLFGLDQISISSPVHREEGHACHRGFLCGERAVLLLEDLDLSDGRLQKRFRIHIFPHFVAETDGTPVTVIAEIP